MQGFQISLLQILDLIGQQMRRNGTLNDTARVEYLQAYIGSMLDAIR